MYTHIHLNSIHIYIPRMTAVSHTISQTNVTQIQSGLHHVHYLPFGGPDKKTKVRHQKFINQETKYIQLTLGQSTFLICPYKSCILQLIMGKKPLRVKKRDENKTNTTTSILVYRNHIPGIWVSQKIFIKNTIHEEKKSLAGSKIKGVLLQFYIAINTRIYIKI